MSIGKWAPATQWKALPSLSGSCGIWVVWSWRWNY